MNKKLPPSHTKHIANKAIALLWLGTFLLVFVMIYQWKNSREDAAPFNILHPRAWLNDNLLLSTEDIELGKNTSLININLNNIHSNTMDTGTFKKEPANMIAYKSILQQKIKKLPR